MLSASSSISFSQSCMWRFICFMSPSGSCSPSVALVSLSKSFTANQRRFSGSTASCIDSSIWARACSTLPVKTWGSSLRIPASCSFLKASASCIASSAAFFVFSLWSALISMVLHPSSLPSFSVSILSPFFLTRSIMLKARTTGSPISTSCVVR